MGFRTCFPTEICITRLSLIRLGAKFKISYITRVWRRGLDGSSPPKVPYLARLGHDETGSPTEIGYLGKIYKNVDFSKILGMALPGGQNVPTPRESILALSRGSQLPYTQRTFLGNFYIIFRIFLYTDSRSTALAAIMLSDNAIIENETWVTL